MLPKKPGKAYLSIKSGTLLSDTPHACFVHATNTRQLSNIFNFFLRIKIFFFYIFSLFQMAPYTEDNVQNALINF